MLLEPISPPLEKRIGIIAHSEGLKALLGGLLSQWGYILTEKPVVEDPVLVQEGCQAPAGNSRSLWLTSSRYEGHNRLPLPLAMDELWRRVEACYHKPPRSHLRIALKIQTKVRARGEITPVEVASLSDLGVRFEFPREMVLGEELTLEVPLEGEVLSLAGRVIYVVPRGDLDGTTRSEIGVIFERIPAETSIWLREHIIWRYLAAVRREIPEQLFREGLEFFRLPLPVLHRLGCA